MTPLAPSSLNIPLPPKARTWPRLVAVLVLLAVVALLALSGRIYPVLIDILLVAPIFLSTRINAWAAKGGLFGLLLVIGAVLYLRLVRTYVTPPIAELLARLGAMA
ncbi:MAG: hypothetical protein ACO1OR_11195 [Hydrogenophaga sp.]|uniref:hypothetical protein n=1 Tax=Hydrogenophaga intermedia TaxID=65786 RepID=UPI0020448443|nr:hypothetical protein [Hydrogenophaga intermedia]MCM3563838.1 hypothetical protein [Hydrogenophaga intermedia]